MNKTIRMILLVLAIALAMQATALAMPKDVEEAVTSKGYNPYDHTSSYTSYDDDELIPVKEDYVATGHAMIRQSPFGVIYGKTVPGHKYYVVGECPDCMWYKIRYQDMDAYVYARYLVPQKKYVPTTTSEPLHIRELDMMMVVTNANSVNIRTAPSTSSKVIGHVQLGDYVHVTGNVLCTEWYECEFNGKTAYIWDNYLTPEFPQTMACTATRLNVRSAPSVDAEIIGTLNHGDKERISAIENDFLRFSLEDGRIGYVYDEYMAVVQ